MSLVGRARRVPELCQLIPQLKVITQHFYYPLHMSEQFLRKNYLENKLSASKIAEITEYATSTVIKALKTLGISRRNTKDLKREGLLLSGGTLAYGKKTLRGKIVDHKRELKVIRCIKKLRTENKYNFSQIARHLTQRNIPTKNRAKAWNHESIKAILIREGLLSPNIAH